MSSKTICNDTESPMRITLYVGGRTNGFESYGTREVELVPGQVMDVDFGDIRHPYLNGIKTETLVAGMSVTNQIMVEEHESDFDLYLNGDEHIMTSTLSRFMLSPPLAVNS